MRSSYVIFSKLLNSKEKIILLCFVKDGS